MKNQRIFTRIVSMALIFCLVLVLTQLILGCSNSKSDKKQLAIEPEAKMTDGELGEMEDSYKNKGLIPKPYSSCTVTDGPALPRSMGGQAGGIVKGAVVIAGGNDWSADRKTKYWLDETYIYNTEDKKWQPGPAYPHKAAYMMFDWDESGLYVAGGTDGTNTYNEVYHMSSHDSWDRLADLPVATSLGGAAIVDGKFYVVCGSTQNGDTNKMYVLDITNPKASWKQCAPLPGVARVLPGMTACNGFLYLLSGLVSEPFEPQKDTYRYDPKTDKWKRLPDLPIKSYCWVANPVDDKHLIAAGMGNGIDDDDGIWIVNIDDMSLNKIGSTPQPVCIAPIVKVGENQWWTIGGEPDATRRRISDVYLVSLR